jgi:hypothetical protein
MEMEQMMARLLAEIKAYGKEYWPAMKKLWPRLEPI